MEQSYLVFGKFYKMKTKLFLPAVIGFIITMLQRGHQTFHITKALMIMSFTVPVIHVCVNLHTLTCLLFRDSAYSLKQDTLNAVSLACAGSVRKKSVFSTSFAPGKNQWRGWKE